MGEHRYLAMETSGRSGMVGLGLDGSLVAARTLDETRRHARDLMPLCRELMTESNGTIADLFAVVVSLGPGSYTGLRVGVMAAKAISYALGCRLIGVPTFDSIAQQCDIDRLQLDVIADALQGKLYCQRYCRSNIRAAWTPETHLGIVPSGEWLDSLTESVAVTGPGLSVMANRVPARILCAPEPQRTPGLPALLALGQARSASAGANAAFSLEPIYLRLSSAEEQWASLSTATQRTGCV